MADPLDRMSGYKLTLAYPIPASQSDPRIAWRPTQALSQAQSDGRPRHLMALARREVQTAAQESTSL